MLSLLLFAALRDLHKKKQAPMHACMRACVTGAPRPGKIKE
jgi:hypothetical protein